MYNIRGTLSVMGLYNYSDNLFDLLTLPAGANKNDIVNSIILECAELETVYPDFGLMRDAIGLWSRTRLHEWERIYLTLTEDYNPLHNYDRHEEWDEDVSSSGHASTSVNGFNDIADRDSSESRASGTQRHSGHLYGNIGVTESTTMAANELNFRKTDFTQIIVEEFKKRFCILVY